MGWLFAIKQGGSIVVQGGAGDRETAAREAKHYAAIYSQDGPVQLIFRRGPEMGWIDGDDPEWLQVGEPNLSK